MAQEDRIKREIDRVGNALLAVLSKLQDLSKEISTKDIIGEIEEDLQTNAAIDLNVLLSVSDAEFEKKIQELHLTGVPMEMFADILYQLGDRTKDDIEQARYYNRSLLLFEKIVSSTKSFSLERYYKMERMKKNIL